METSDKEALKSKSAQKLKEFSIVTRADKIKAKQSKVNDGLKRFRQNQNSIKTSENIDVFRYKEFDQNRQHREKIKAAATPEEIEAKRLKHRQYREKRIALATPEEVEAMRLKKLEQSRKYRQKRKALATSDEVEAMPFTKLKQKRQYRKKQKAPATPEEMEAIRFKRNEYKRLSRIKKIALATPEEVFAMRLKQRQYREERKALATSEEVEAMRLKKSEGSRKYRQKCKAAARQKEVDSMQLKSFGRRKQHCKDKREGENSIIREATKLDRQNQDVSADERGILKLADKIKAQRLRKSEQINQLTMENSSGRQQTTETRNSASMETSNKDVLKLKLAERQKKYYQKKREKEESILRKALDLLSQNKELSFEENAIMRKAEEIKAQRLKKNYNLKQYLLNRKATASPEKNEALRLRKMEQARQYRQEKRKKEESILKKATDLLNQKKKVSSEDNAILRKADEINAERLKKRDHFKQYFQKRKAEATPEKIEALRIKKLEQTKGPLQKRKASATLEEKEAMRLKHSEQARKYKLKKRDKDKSILKKATELLSQNQALSVEEKNIVKKAEEIKAQRLKKSEYSKQYFHNRIAAASPEEAEEMRLKRSEQVRRYRQEKREQFRKCRQEKREMEESILKKAMDLSFHSKKLSLEEKEIERKAKEIEEMRSIRLERVRRCRRKKREKEESFLKKAKGLLGQNKKLSLEEKSMVKKADKINVRSKTEVNKPQRENRDMHSNEISASILPKKIKADRSKKDKYVSGTLKTNRGTSDVPSVLDEIKIEEEVLQESTIKTIPIRKNWLNLSESFITGDGSQSTTNFPSFYGKSSNISNSFGKSNHHSTKIDRRKSELKEVFHCMRVLIDTTVKSYGLDVFGKQIAQKLRTSQKDEAEVSVAKLLIDNVLHSLAIGTYSSKTKVV